MMHSKVGHDPAIARDASDGRPGKAVPLATVQRLVSLPRRVRVAGFRLTSNGDVSETRLIADRMG
jgi:hypothetical protein